MLKWIHRWSGLDRVFRVLDLDRDQEGPEFVDRILSEFRLRPVAMYPALPGARSAVFLCTHHTGAADFLAAYAVLKETVPNLKVVMNEKLLVLPPLAKIGIGVRAISTKKENGGARAGIRAHLESGGNILVFPAGKVGFLRGGRVTDQPWRRGVARIIRESAACAVPVHIDARNDTGFYLLRDLFPRLGMLLLLRMLRLQQCRPIPVRVGKPIPASLLGRFDDHKMLDVLRRRTYELLDEREETHVLVTA